MVIPTGSRAHEARLRAGASLRRWRPAGRQDMPTILHQATAPSRQRIEWFDGTYLRSLQNHAPHAPSGTRCDNPRSRGSGSERDLAPDRFRTKQQQLPFFCVSRSHLETCASPSIGTPSTAGLCAVRHGRSVRTELPTACFPFPGLPYERRRPKYWESASCCP